MRARGFIENRRFHKALGLKRPGSLRKTINRYERLSDSRAGALVMGALIGLAGLVIAHWLSWALWIRGIWG